MKRFGLGGLIGLCLLVSSTAHAAHFGLFVGLNQYSTSYIASNNWLNYCVPDAVDFRDDLLTHSGGWVATNTTLLTNSLGNKTAIRLAMSNYASKAVAGDTFVYFHSSHGGNDDTTQANVYLCTYNADYTEDELATDLSAFPSGATVIVVVDACHSGGLFMETSVRSIEDKIARRRLVRNWNIAERVTIRMEELRAERILVNARAVARLISPDEVGWMTACAWDQYSYEDASIGHGWFTYELLGGFTYGDSSGDGWATFKELFDFAYLRIPYPDQTPRSLNPSILAAIAGTAGTTPPGDAWDYADNVIEGATPLSAQPLFATTGVHTLHEELDNSDFFVFPVHRGFCYTFRSTNTAGGGDVDADLYTWSEDAGPNLIRYAYDIDYPTDLEFEIVYKAFETGLVYLQVKPYFSGGTNLTYQLTYAEAGSGDSMGLTNGASKTVDSIAQSGWVDFVLQVPPGQTNLVITQSGGTGDADLYVARGYLPWYSWDYYSENYGNNETITISDPETGEWFIESYGYEASSNFTLRATYSPGGAAITTASNTGDTVTFDLNFITNGARVAIYSATNLLPSGHLGWTLRSNNAVVVDGKVSVSLPSNAPKEIISVGRPLDL